MTTVPRAVPPAQVRSEKAPPDASQRQRVEVLFPKAPSPLYRMILARGEPPP